MQERPLINIYIKLQRFAREELVLYNEQKSYSLEAILQMKFDVATEAYNLSLKLAMTAYPIIKNEVFHLRKTSFSNFGRGNNF